MLASLSIADYSLFESLIEATFPQHPPAGSGPNGSVASQYNAVLIGQAIRDKTIATVQTCKDMLLEEPPERMTEFWGMVRTSCFLFRIFRAAQETGFVCDCADSIVPPPQPESSNLMKPLNKKLKKCRDPDRFDLVGLHKKRLESREEKESATAKNAVEDDGAVFGSSIKGDADREAKRRKVTAEDPFGPPL